MTMTEESAVTDKYLIAQCFFAHSTQLLINAAKVLNKPEDVQQYTDSVEACERCFFKRICDAFRQTGIQYTDRLCTGASV